MISSAVENPDVIASDDIRSVSLEAHCQAGVAFALSEDGREIIFIFGRVGSL
jgi:hypothetical protein